jgi:AraC family transcriptional regulator of adaptative response/methylated-DNA-[protein]-cysteine methyltransferase
MMLQPIPAGLADPGDEWRWQAVQQRDARADGHFVYAVRSTGVYCRPSCPARTPLRRNVSFFPACAQAEAAGFRACLRCKPDQPDLAARQLERVAAACRLIEQSDQAPSLQVLAAEAGLSPFHFHRLFRQHTGVTPRAYAAAVRQGRLADALRAHRTVAEAGYAAGFQSNAQLYAEALPALGVSPGRFRAGGAGLQLMFACAPCALGTVLVAASGHGLAAILLGDEAAPLEADLRARFPKARVERGGKALDQLLAAVVRVVDGQDTGTGLPLDVRGTAFQRRVWEALRAIPPGQTVTYAGLAGQLGMAAGARAVAAACAANPLAVLVPCHRVIRGDGALAGYRWGLERKRALLARERLDATRDPDAA